MKGNLENPIYPKTPECNKYLQIRKQYEDDLSKRVGWRFFSAAAGTSGFNNAGDNENFRQVQLAYHDCQMTAQAFFIAKNMTKSKLQHVVAENEVTSPEL